MSITIKSTPDDFSSAHEELWHVVDSTNKNGDGFRYVFDIYKDGDIITRVKSEPFGTDKYGVINVGSIVRSTLDSSELRDFDIYSQDAEFTMNTDVFFTDYQLRYGEDASGVITTNLASGSYRAYNNYTRPNFERLDTSLSSGVIITSNRPATVKIYEDSLSTTHPVVFSHRLNSGVNYRREFRYTDNSTETRDVFGSGQCIVFPVTNPTCNRLRIINQDTSAVIKTYEIENKCTKYECFTLVFLNAFGGYDSFTFVNGVLMQTGEKKSFEKQRWKLDGFTMKEKLYSGIYNESIMTYANMIKSKMKLTSDFLTTEEYAWLAELVNSPLVYLLRPGQDLIPVKITNTDYEFTNSLQNKAKLLEVEIEFGIVKNSQFR